MFPLKKNSELSVQKQIVRTDPNKPDPDSVQGILEICSKIFNPVNEPQVYVSSRTDQGVHALCSAAHVDLECKSGLKYNPDNLAVGYNRYFTKANIELRVQSAHVVPDTFHARHSVKSRTYLYRLAVRNPDAPEINKRGNYIAEIPFIEWKRCHFIYNAKQFDISLLKDAARLFPGIKDFRTFMGSINGTEEKETIREIYRLDISPGTPLLGAYSPFNSYYTFWDITCQSRSFLYRQVRRIVGALIGVAQGVITLSDIRYMLQNPSKDSWSSKLQVVPPHGLYLVNVEYDPLDMKMPEETLQKDCENKILKTAELNEVKKCSSI